MRILKVLITALSLGASLSVQSADYSEREELYRRYLDFPKYVKGGTVDPHWMADGLLYWGRTSTGWAAPLPFRDRLQRTTRTGDASDSGRTNKNGPGSRVSRGTRGQPGPELPLFELTY